MTCSSICRAGRGLLVVCAEHWETARVVTDAPRQEGDRLGEVAADLEAGRVLAVEEAMLYGLGNGLL